MYILLISFLHVDLSDGVVDMYILMMAWCTCICNSWRGVHVNLTDGVVNIYILLITWCICTSY